MDKIFQNQTFSDQFIKIMDAIGQKIGVAIDWTSQNVFPYLQDLLSRIIKLEITTSIFWIVLSLAAIAFSVLLFKLEYKYDETDGLFYVIAVFLVSLAIVVICFQVYDIIIALCLPEQVYLDFFNKYKYLIK